MFLAVLALMTGCEIVGFDTGMPAEYEWLLAHQGTMRSGGRVLMEPGSRLTCEALGIEPDELATARWIYVVRHEAGKDPQFLRGAPTGPVCNLDIDGDGVVSVTDLGQVKAQFFMARDQYLCSADFSGDGVVNAIDLGMLRVHFMERCD